MTQIHRRARQLLLVALTASMALGGGVAHAQSASPAPSPSAAPTVAPDASPGLEDQLAQARADLAAAQQQSKGLQALLDFVTENYDALESSRQLLLELRKDLPDRRADAEVYLDKIQHLATEADATNLGQPAKRLQETAPAFLDWRDGTYVSQAEKDNAFLTSGAAGFATDFSQLKDAVLLSVANRLDALLSLRDRIR
ncbi:MAG: hypothetical protein U0869_17260 [Chloroflexota bacterium]